MPPSRTPGGRGSSCTGSVPRSGAPSTSSPTGHSPYAPPAYSRTPASRPTPRPAAVPGLGKKRRQVTATAGPIGPRDLPPAGPIDPSRVRNTVPRSRASPLTGVAWLSEKQGSPPGGRRELLIPQLPRAAARSGRMAPAAMRTKTLASAHLADVCRRGVYLAALRRRATQEMPAREYLRGYAHQARRVPRHCATNRLIRGKRGRRGRSRASARRRKSLLGHGILAGPDPAP